MIIFYYDFFLIIDLDYNMLIELARILLLS